MDFPGEKLVIKLWETLTEKGIGSLLSPWQLGREGRARTEVRQHEVLMLAQAETDAADIRAGRKHLRSDGVLLLTNLPQSTDPRPRMKLALTLVDAANYGARTAAATAARTEINASKAILFAEDQLAADSQNPPAGNIDEDWLFAWRENAGKVSAEDLQRLWGSVLAGEIKAPGKYSIRTLEFLKTLSKQEAELISQLASYVIDGRIARAQKTYLDSKGLTFSRLLMMQELGVLSGVEAIGLSTTYTSIAPHKFTRALVSHGKALIIEHEDSSKALKIEIYMLTAVGRQVLGLGSFEPDVEYMRLVAKDILKQGFTAKLSDWRDISESQGEYFNAQDILGDAPIAEV